MGISPIRDRFLRHSILRSSEHDQNADVRPNPCRVNLNLMSRHKRKENLKLERREGGPQISLGTAPDQFTQIGFESIEPPKDQTRLAALPMVFTPQECLQLIADFTPHLKPALVETMDLAQSASIRKSSAVFVFPDESTNWVFERLRKVIHVHVSQRLR
jgi:hypothetical protein